MFKVKEQFFSISLKIWKNEKKRSFTVYAVEALNNMVVNGHNTDCITIKIPLSITKGVEGKGRELLLCISEWKYFKNKCNDVFQKNHLNN